MCESDVLIDGVIKIAIREKRKRKKSFEREVKSFSKG